MVIRTTENLGWQHVEKDRAELDAIIKHFELYNKTEGKSPQAKAWYSMVLRQFHRFLLEIELCRDSKSTRLN